MTNRINATVSKDDMAVVQAAIETINTTLPFLIDLTPPERIAIPKLSDKNHAFVRKALEIATQNQGMLARSFSIDDMRKHTELLESLATVRLTLGKICNMVDDTTMLVGAEAFAAARAVYAATKTPFAPAALRTASEELAKAFKTRKRSAAGSSNEPASETNAQSETVTA